MFKRASLQVLRRRLAEIDAEIAAHPLASERVQHAHEVVERHRAMGAAEVNQVLAERGLPSLEELGKIQAKSSLAWWWLHRKRRAIIAKIERFG